jgi:hypothetical protein
MCPSSRSASPPRGQPARRCPGRGTSASGRVASGGSSPSMAAGRRSQTSRPGRRDPCPPPPWLPPGRTCPISRTPSRALVGATDLSLAALPESGSWRLHAAAGLRSGDGWLQGAQGGAAPYDLLFVGESPTSWQHAAQADLLAASDITAAAVSSTSTCSAPPPCRSVSATRPASTARPSASSWARGSGSGTSRLGTGSRPSRSVRATAGCSSRTRSGSRRTTRRSRLSGLLLPARPGRNAPRARRVGERHRRAGHRLQPAGQGAVWLLHRRERARRHGGLRRPAARLRHRRRPGVPVRHLDGGLRHLPARRSAPRSVRCGHPADRHGGLGRGTAAHGRQPDGRPTPSRAGDAGRLTGDARQHPQPAVPHLQRPRRPDRQQRVRAA